MSSQERRRATALKVTLKPCTTRVARLPPSVLTQGAEPHSAEAGRSGYATPKSGASRATSPSRSLCSGLGPGEAIDLSDTESIASSASTQGTKRGRPPTTGDYARKKLLQAAEGEERDRQRELEFADSLPAGALQRGATNNIGRATEARMRELSNNPSVDLAASILERMSVVERVAQTSSNLKGTYMKALQETSIEVRAALSIIMQRTADGGAEETNILRQEVESLRAQVRELREALRDVGNRRGANPPPQPTSTACGGAETVRDLPRSRSPSHRSSMRGRGDRSRSPQSQPRGRVDAPPRQREEGATAMSGLEERIVARIEAILDHRIGAVAPRPAGDPGGKGESRKLPPPPPKTTGRAEMARPAPPNKKTGAAKKGKGGREKGRGLDGREVTPAQPAPRPEPPPSQQKTRPLPPPPPSTAQGEVWARVVGRKEARAAKKAARPSAPPPPTTTRGGAPQQSKGKGGGAKAPPPPPKKPRVRKPPASAAITLNGPEKGYAAAMAAFKADIRLEDLGIPHVRVKRALTGARILEVPGPDAHAKADKLAEGIRGVLTGGQWSVVRPTKKAEMMVRGLEDSISANEVAAAIATAGGCSPTLVETGPIKEAPDGLGRIWVRCPAVAALKVAKQARIQIGWTRVGVVLLEPRPLQCYKCLEVGHVQQR
ncbi:formin-like protein 5 [Ooceraea biroi]|uniref:formin-like protein 5 n=1 Tax=Ooceraea biroi TaxID=2015173 RepID=UPI000F0929E6|nr:formin-like protein 5 [Ooceraea biroi]